MAREVSHGAAVERLMASGGPFELQECADHGRIGRCWKNGPQTLEDIFNATAKFEDREFLVAGDERLTYGEFRSRVWVVAAHLRSKAITKDSVVAISTRSEVDLVVTFFGSVLAGALPAVTNPAMTPEEFLTVMLDLSPAALVCDPSIVDRFSLDSAATHPVPGVMFTTGPVSADGSPRRTPPLSSLWSHLPTRMAGIGAVGDRDRSAPADDGLVIFTSGTTGRPKGIVLSHRCCAYSVFHAAFRNARAAGGVIANVPPGGEDEQQVLLLGLPLFHAAGICDALLPLMWRGGRVVMVQRWSPLAAARLVEREGASIAALVPSAAEALFGSKHLASSLASLSQVFCGGAPFPERLVSMLTSAGVTPGQNYGLSETGGAVIGHCGPEFADHPSSCGQPLPILEAMVIDPDGRECPAGEVGELILRGPQVMTRYWRDEKSTREAISDGWLHTGDLARMDLTGRCQIVDRAKDIVISAGENIYCSEIEAALETHPNVREAALIGIPDQRLGEKALGVVTLRDAASTSADELRQFLAGRLSPFKIPAIAIYPSEDLPKNHIGKVVKASLRTAYGVGR